MRRTSNLTILLAFLITGCMVPASSGPQPPSQPPAQPMPPPPDPQPQPQPAPMPAPVPQPPPMPVPPPPPPVAWDSTGWTLLGERAVNAGSDHDRIAVGRDDGRFTTLTVLVLDSDLEMLDMDVRFGKGKPFSPKLAHVFRENSRTRVIDLPGNARVIKTIDFRYRNLPGGGRARVQVWGRGAGDAQPAPVPPPPPVFDSTGWTKLGERVVSGKGDRDKIKVGRNDGTFRRLTMVVLDSELELLELEVKFGNGQPFRPEVRQVFGENSRTRVIDLPGDRRTIKWIELRYRNLPGGGRARVQLWAQ